MLEYQDSPNSNESSTYISVSVSGDLTVWAKDEVEIGVNGSGDVAYYERPMVNQRGFGSENVRSLGDKKQNEIQHLGFGGHKDSRNLFN